MSLELAFHADTATGSCLEFMRDGHMFTTPQALLGHRGEGAKPVVRAHNSHIGNAAATPLGWQGEFNIGELCRADKVICHARRWFRSHLTA